MLRFNELYFDLIEAKKPLFVFGSGARLAACEARELASFLKIPICVTWGAVDLFPDCVGTFGTHGVRAANFAVQSADLIICVGSRLDTKATGSPVSSFAPKAKLVMVDIDQAEIDKMEKLGRSLYRSYCMDAKEFLSGLESILSAIASHDLNTSTFKIDAWEVWNQKIEEWKKRYPVCLPEYEKEAVINPYVFVREMGKHLKPDDVIVSDTGCALGWMMQGYKFKGERFIHAFNQTPMGYGLPAAVGAAFATGKRVICITGDGGLSVNVTEMATIAGHKLPIKVILFANGSHSMCMQTQRMWLNSEYPATSKEGGLHFPDFAHVARAYGLYGVSTEWADSSMRLLGTILKIEGPALLQLKIDRLHGIVGQIKYGEPLAELQEAA